MRKVIFSFSCPEFIRRSKADRLHIQAGLCLALSLCLMATACSKDLSRNRAEKLLQENAEFQAGSNEELAVGTLWCDWRNVNDLYNYKSLAENGVLTLKETGRKDGWWTKEYSVELTPRGKEAATTWTKTADKPHWCTEAAPSSAVFLIPLAKRELVGVTGITGEPGDKSAQVEFDWKWTPTKGSDILSGKVPSNEIRHGKAEAQLYDDGWRITALEM